MINALILIVAAIVLMAIFTAYNNHKHEKKAQAVFESMDGFKFNEIYLSGSQGISLAYDSSQKKICFLDANHEPKIYDYKDILESILIIDGETISKQSTTGTVGRAVLGGLIAGGTGAIIGGVTSSKKNEEKVTSIDLKVAVNDSKTPFYKVNFLNLESKKGSSLYNVAYEQGERWHGIIATLIRQANEKLEDEKTGQQSGFSLSDELSKLKKLKDDGILTQDEFETQKEKLLNK